MNQHSKLCCLALLATGAAQAFSQSAASPVETAEEEIELSPFMVAAEKDEGFVAASSLAGGRLSTALKETPVAYSVVTRDFLDALDLNDTESAMSWSVGAYAPQADTINYKLFNNESGSSVMSRGVQTTSTQRNFFLLGQNSDTYSQERIDFARGPNALLIGTSGLGGVVNSITKRARTDKAFTTVTLQTGSWDKYRGAIDVNQPVGKTAAVRVNAMKQTADSWRDMQYDKRKGAHFALTLKPFKTTQVRAEYETYSNDTLAAPDYLLDNVSGWDGVTTVASPTASITGSTAKGIARVGSSSAPYLVYIPGLDTGTVMNWANSWRTVGGGASSAVPVNGVLPLSTANLGVSNGQMAIGTVYSPESLYSTAVGNSYFRIPERETVLVPNMPSVTYRFQDTALFLEHQQGRHLFFEAGGNYVRSEKVSEYLAARTLRQVYIDVNRTLPDGTQNPNFLQPYGEGYTDHTHFFTETYETRASMALVFENTRWGDFRANVIAGTQNTDALTVQYTDVLNRSSDIRKRARDDIFYYRYYLNGSKPYLVPDSVNYVDPISGTTTRYDVDTVVDTGRANGRLVSTDFKYLQGAFNAKILKERLNLTLGFRRDLYTCETLTPNSSVSAIVNDYPANWDGQTFYTRPSAPNDYWDLTYVPKDSSGTPTGPATLALTRPRDSSGAPLTQYANDRFRDDYSSPAVHFDVNTISYGGVANLTRVASLYGNFAKSFNAPSSGRTLTGESVPPGLSSGWDAGIRFSLMNDKIVASFGKYGSKQLNNSLDSSSSTRKYATIVEANAVGDQSSNGMNIRGMSDIPTPTFDFQDRRATGYEVDIVANLTNNWRMTFNAAVPKVRLTRTRQDEWAFLAANEDTLKQIVIDAGGKIDASNVATVDTSVPEAERSPDVSDAVTAWNNIQTFKATNDPTAVTPTQLPKFTANFYTDYRIGRGLLKNLRIGGGIQYLGKKVIGNRGADTIVDPTNSAKAIDDPSVDSSTAVYMGGYSVVAATISYQFKVRRNNTVNLRLNIGNVLNNRDLIYIGTALRPPGGDISRPDRVTVPESFIYRQPRSFTLTASCSF